ncbi:secretin and TonB N-terminal domain-containing protein [Sphingobacterium yanglingense]|uniref:Secretin/TonB-like protein n=1 Tax=Sphingobacterium yanglingense TaxID=1437280 RepID=A0A4R6WKM1_9SPHI|nr:secretin and TonB N-terminal domain-containing protein [Sphingobacterium yanglingense]TDQ79262.1 secretin/TonB-like protein [Sphingobacterium yanglingense]
MKINFHIKQDFIQRGAVRISSLDRTVLFKILMTMKLTVLLMTIFTLSVQATVHGQRVDLKVNKVRLDKVFDEIYTQSGYAFVFNAKQLRAAKPVTVELKGMPVEQAIKAILADQPFDYTIDEKVITIREKKIDPKKSKIEMTQYEDPETKDLIIEGTVLDEETKDPIEGVTVELDKRGVKLRTQSDTQGRFRLVIPKR